MLHYSITPSDLHAHLFSVSLEISEPASDGVQLTLPAWIPGSYMIRDFARNVVDLRAEANGQPLKVTSVDKQTWQLAATDGPVTVHYQVYAFDLSVRSAYLDQYFGFFNNSSLCLAVQGQADRSCTLAISLPDTETPWQLATGMPRQSGDQFGSGVFTAGSYEELIDYPVLMGQLAIQEFIAGGLKHGLVVAGHHYGDLGRISGDLAQICEYQIDLFDHQVPFESYLFLTIVVGKGFGGLEHRNSTALLCSRKDLILPGKQTIDNDYRGFLSLCSHEYFHSWNIKTLKPREFIPYRLAAEQYTRQLWFYEGITSYFDDYVLHQCGLIDAATYLQLVGDTIARVQRSTGANRQTVTDSSLYAWTKFYKQDENSPNSIVSYYAKGGLIALCLDLLLRRDSDHQVTLGTVMRDYWLEYGATGKGTEDESFASFVEQKYSVKLAAFLERALYSTDPLPLNELLSEFGVELSHEVAADDNTIGGKPASNNIPVALGAKYKASPQGLELQTVYNGEAAERAGLSAQDRIIAIDRLQVTEQSVKEVFDRYQPDQQVTVHAFRRDELLSLKLVWDKPRANNRVLRVKRPEQLKGWLNPKR
ncbi:aminopeptidase [Pseudidiomarina salinarum]|uniref:Aminopeptidase n=1 Tax=Pseudidiomarina salinarum TaxID=435908 RepID=A0A094JH58_9GAMM|nr:PDZ domain-containing protein [Pseudidiomarina salinarum]KFZ31866.1 aminopeptidase [Pseudidiomarina salinarum]RUO70362.1 aminopeptidase [Pseudidiomarina salinarum]